MIRPSAPGCLSCWTALCLTLGAGAAGAQGVGVPAGPPTQAERVQQEQRRTLPVLPGFPWDSRAQDARPALELLVTVRLLRDLLGRPAGADMAAPTRLALRDELRALLAAPSLSPQDWAQRREALLAALPPSGQRQVQERRAALEARVRDLLDRARLARPQHPADVPLRVYSFMVPGGQDIVRQVYDDPRWNPFRVPGPSATLLGDLLQRLDSPPR